MQTIAACVGPNARRTRGKGDSVRRIHSCLRSVVALGVLWGLFSADLAQAATTTVLPTVETQPVPNSDDAADDPAIWVHPTDVAKSTIIGTDKQGGLAVYSLDGREVQYRADGKMINVDLRYNVRIGSQNVALVAASNRSRASISLYAVTGSGTLTNIAGTRISPGVSPYGLCMYQSPRTGKTYAFVNSPSGGVEQWELYDNGAGKVDGRRVRSFSVGSGTEGCVADDRTGTLYIGEERVGVWRYGAEPDAGNSRTAVAKVSSSGPLVADVEGLTLYETGEGAAYLLVSSQGNDSFAVYRADGANDYIGSFVVGDGTIDGATTTDGIAVVNMALGAGFPTGLFVAHDGENLGGNQNFKLVPWQQIADGLGLRTDTRYDVRTRTTPAIPDAPVELPGRIEAEAYRPGGQGYGYTDTTSGNTGGVFRNDDVDIQACGTGCYAVGWVAAGEWLAYDVNVATAGTYQFQVRAATPNTGRKLHIAIDDQNVTGSIVLPQTANYQTWGTATSISVPLTAGRHTLTIVAESSSFNLDSLTVALLDAPPAPTSPVDGTTAIRPEADARVESANPQTNYGASASLRVDGAGDPEVESLVRFTVSDSTPAFERAILRIYTTSSSSDGPAVYSASNDWNEQSVTWGTRPARASTPLADAGRVSAGSWVEYDVSSLVRGAGTYTFVLVATSRDGLSIHSREAANAPELVLK